MLADYSKRIMKILHITEDFAPKYGGIAHALKSLSTMQAKMNHEIAIVAATPSNDLAETFKPENVNVEIIHKDVLSNIWNSHSVRLRSMLRKILFEFDIIHIHGIWHYPCFIAAKIARREKIPYIITPHGALEPWCLEYKRFKKKIYYKLAQEKQLRDAAIIHAITRQEANNIGKLIPRARVMVVPNGVDLPERLNDEEKKLYEHKYEYLSGKKTILFLGRIHPKKGLDILIRAYAIAKKAGIGHILVIAGPDEVGWKKTLRRIADEAGVEDSVFFIGFIEGKEKQYVLETADIFIMPSHSEGFSVAILEAMSFSKPVIITKGCNFPEIEKEGAGIVVDPTEEEIAKAIIRMASDVELARYMGDNARNLIINEYTWDKIASRTIQMYKEAINVGGL